MKEDLNSLLVGFWEKIVVQGGKLDRSPSGSEYLLSGVSFYCHNKWIEISATEYKLDEYWLVISVMDKAPIPEHSKINNPPRQLLSTTPDDCRLDKMSTDGVEGAVISNFEQSHCEFFSGERLVLRCHSGDMFEIAASEKFPGNIEIRSF